MVICFAGERSSVLFASAAHLLVVFEGFLLCRQSPTLTWTSRRSPARLSRPLLLLLLLLLLPRPVTFGGGSDSSFDVCFAILLLSLTCFAPGPKPLSMSWDKIPSSHLLDRRSTFSLSSTISSDRLELLPTLPFLQSLLLACCCYYRSYSSSSLCPPNHLCRRHRRFSRSPPRRSTLHLSPLLLLSRQTSRMGSFLQIYINDIVCRWPRLLI